MANTRELAQFASFVDFTGTSIGFSTQFNVSGVSTFTNTVIFDSTGSIQIPKGTTGQRLSGVLGQIRYNTSLSQFEGYGAGNAWGSLGGVKDVSVLVVEQRLAARLSLEQRRDPLVKALG